MSCDPILRLGRMGIVVAALLLLTLSGKCMANDAKSPVLAYYYLLHWASLGDADRALAQFADEAIVVAGPLCTQEDPCIGRTAIRERYIVPLIARPGALPVNDAQFDGRRLRTRGDVLRTPPPPSGVEHPVGGHVFEFGDGRITSLREEVGERGAASSAAASRPVGLGDGPVARRR